MKVLITGAEGQLGKEITVLLQDRKIHCLPCSREDLDVTSLEAVSAKVLEYRPDVIIHAAAYTQVDLAESNEKRAFDVNAMGTKNVAQTAEKIGAAFCYISTDFVFDGKTKEPYMEDADVEPLGVYGKTKYAGEQFTKEFCSKYYIVRTSWVFGAHGNNFVKTMLKLGKERNSLQVVADQVGSPTYTADLANFLLELVQTDKYGIYHATNSGSCSWYEFACEIFAQSGIKVEVEPIKTEQFPRPAPRPTYSVLKHGAIQKNQFEDLRDWRKALQAFLKEIGVK